MAESNTYGEIISLETAEQDFGPVSSSATISSDQLKALSDRTVNLMMFNLAGGTIYILGDERSLLYPEGAEVSSGTVFKVYSKTKVLELMNTGKKAENAIEMRGETLTISNGDHTLEFGTLCPPWCSE